MESFLKICTAYIILNIIPPVFCFVANAKFSNSDQRLFTAIKTGNIKAVQKLIVDTDVNTIDEKGDGLLHWAARWDNENVVDLKIKNDASSSRTFENLYFTTAASKRYIADLFTKVGWKVSQRKHGNKQIVELLIDNGADVNLKNNAGQTALHEAAHWGNERIVELLLKNGANVNKANTIDGNTALHDAALNGNEKIVNMLIRKGADVNHLDVKLKSPLHWAIAAGNKNVVETLIRNRANLDLVDDDGNTVLFSAIEGGLDDIAEILIKKGANVKLARNNGRTALHWAAQRGNLKIVNLLIANGLDIDIEDKNGTIAMDLAKKYGHTDIVDLLSHQVKNIREDRYSDDSSFIPIESRNDDSV